MASLLRGIDVSDAQGDIDWGRVHAAGVWFAFLKATEGQDWTATRFTKTRLLAMRRAKVRIGCYHYLRPRRDRTGDTEAKHFVQTVKDAGWKAGTDLPLCVDVEWTGNTAELHAMTGAQVREYVSAFCDYVYRVTKRGCITYLSPGFASELGNRAPRHGSSSWVAAWDAPDGKPPTPAGFPRRLVRFHQVSDKAHVDGVPTAVDLNVFRGGHADLDRVVAWKPVTPVAPPAPSNPEKATVREQQTMLRKIGWPITVDGKTGPQTKGALTDFQGGFAGPGGRLTRDGVAGTKTLAALKWSVAHNGACSPNFKFTEFRSKHESCHGNDWIKTNRDLVLGLEKYRAKAGATAVVSGYRDPAKNECEGGAKSSQHMYGNATDLNPRFTVAQVRELGAFSGIGYQRATGLVRHVDVRHRGPNFTNGSVGNPTIWIYG